MSRCRGNAKSALLNVVSTVTLPGVPLKKTTLPKTRKGTDAQNSVGYIMQKTTIIGALWVDVTMIDKLIVTTYNMVQKRHVPPQATIGTHLSGLHNTETRIHISGPYNAPTRTHRTS